MKKRRIVITMGDPAGVGPEVIAKALAKKSVRTLAQFAVVGNRRILEDTAERLQLSFPLRVTKDTLPEFNNTPVLVEADRMRESPLLPGRWSLRTGRASLRYILAATHMCLEKHADAMVTAPVCKAALQKAGCRYPGHTELIADLCHADKVVMMLTGGGLRVALVTTHAAVASLPQLVTRGEVCGALLVLHQELRESYGIERPRIAVLGLNPHAGEGGMIGQEEKVHIVPAMKAAAKKGAKGIGPLPADTSFHRMLQGEFDAILAMYHDQGLGPLKTVAFDSGVNVTLGLPIIRTSVDHGTAFDIAGKGIASERSLVEAIQSAVEIARNRLLGARP
ncbi:MAG: 4-hydroxythreonine-4-phosphate dehydrogenase PdxA [Planctomycetota bacterium]|jgi:4-hydroxythreonine-4-phosphate dehydrogenase